MPRPDLSRQAGMALLAALLVAALATLLASRILAAQDDFVSLVTTERDLGQARRLALAGIDLARAVLVEDALQGGADHLGEAWATPIRETPVEGGSVAGGVVDAQARFNLACLLQQPSRAVDPGAVAVYERLLAALQLDPALAPAAAGWLAAGGTESWPTIESLARVPGYTPAALERLRPYAGFLPECTPVNVNTAAAPVLAAVTGLSPAAATALAAGRQPVWFRNLGDFRQRAPQATGEARFWATASDHFEAGVTARHGVARQHLRALIQRRPGVARVLAIGEEG